MFFFFKSSGDACVIHRQNKIYGKKIELFLFLHTHTDYEIDFYLILQGVI